MKITNRLLYAGTVLAVTCFLFGSCSKTNDQLRPQSNTLAATSLTAVTTASATTQPTLTIYYDCDGRFPKGANSPLSLSAIPNGVDQVVFFVGSWSQFVDTTNNPLSSGQKAMFGSYKNWIAQMQQLRARGIKVLFCDMDATSWMTTTPRTDNGLAETAAQYAANVSNAILNIMHIDGLVLDVEAPRDHTTPSSWANFPAPPGGWWGGFNMKTTELSNYLNVIKELGKKLGPKSGNNSLLCLVSDPNVYQFKYIMDSLPGYFNNIQFMYYTGTVDFYNQNFTYLKTNYQNIDFTKLLPAVSGESPDYTTAQAIAQWQPSGGQKGGMMIYAANSDTTLLRLTLQALKNSSVSNVGVQFYQNYNYGGATTQLIPKGSYTLSQLKSYGFINDWASSVNIPSGWTVIMYANDNFSGQSWTLTSNNSQFGTLSPSANDVVSSVKIQ